MTENMKIAMNAINKWMFFSWNYEFVFHSYTDLNDEEREVYVPKFLAETQWSCGFSHIYNKWQWVTSSFDDSSSYISHFYAELSVENRRALITWVMANKVDVSKILAD